MTITGVDVSGYQKGWKPASSDSFVFIKATEGRSYTNPAMRDQAKAARDKNLVVGFYHWLHPGNVAEQAKYFVEQCDSLEGDLLVCDWEQAGTTNAEKDAFIKEVKRLRPTHKVGLYCNTYWWKTNDKTSYAGDFLWIANYTGKTGVQAKTTFWQWTDKPIDQNRSVFNSLTELRTWARALIPVKVTPKPPVVTTPNPTTPAPKPPATPAVTKIPRPTKKAVSSSPVKVITGGSITTPYGRKATNPATGRSYWAAGYHPGDDWNTPGQDKGKPAYSAVTGKVVHAGRGGWGSAYGNHVIVQSSDGRQTAHCHFSVVSVKKNQTVKAGDRLGSVGDTGNVTGPHVHVERRKSPYRYGNFERPKYENVGGWDGLSYPGSTAFVIGRSHAAVTLLGKMLVALKLAKYSVGPGPEFGPADQAAVKKFQQAQGWKGSDADGIPGKTTWDRLISQATYTGTAPQPTTPAKPTPKPPTPAPKPPVPKPTTPYHELVAELDGPGGGAWQGIQYNHVKKEFLLAHSDGDHNGHLYRFGYSDKIQKPYKGRMDFDGLTHIYGFGYFDDGKLWLPWDAKDGRDIVEVAWKDGAKPKKSATKKLHVFTEYPAQASLSHDRVYAVIWETIGNDYVFTLRRVGDIRANKNEPLSKRIVIPIRKDTWFQGFTTRNNNLYVAWGKTDEKAWIDRYDFSTRSKTGTYSLTGVGLLPGESKSGAALEVEGMDAMGGGLLISIKAFKDTKRRMRVYKIFNF